MSADLRERLAGLAGEAHEHRAAASAPELWRRGRRRQARERVAAGAAMVLVLACLGSLIGLGVLPGTSPDVAGSPRAAGLPDRFYDPSPWLAGTADGPVGPLVAVLDASRSGWHGWTSTSRSSFVVVSATTGAYRFLDLPGAAYDTDLVGGQAVSLSPDGRYVAYWLAGSRPDRRGVQHSAVVGYAVYDTVSGHVDRFAVSATRGLSPIGTAWIGDQAWFQYGAVDERDAGRTSASGRRTMLVDAARGVTSRLAGRQPDLAQVFVGAGGFVAAGSRTVTVLTRAGTDGRVVRPDRRLTSVYPSPDGTRIAGLPQTYGCCSEAAILVGRAAGSPTLARVGTGVAVLGWRDDRHVVVQRRSGVVQSVDVTTGVARTLTRLPGTVGVTGARLAAGLLSAPVVAGRRPPDTPDPRVRPLLLGLAAAGVGVLLVVAGRVRRRRVRA